MGMDRKALQAASVTLNAMMPKEALPVEEHILKEAIAAYLRLEYQNQCISKTVTCGRCGQTGESPF